MSILRHILTSMAILAVIGLPVETVFAQVLKGVQQAPGTGHAARGANYFTILGHIRRPNSYELPTSSPSLVSFVKFTGDLTRTASGNIRIVRDGRVLQSTFYTDNSTLRLSPGDIVIVDGRVGQGRILFLGNQNANSAVDDDATVGNVSVAITGIRDYPLVLTMPEERATIRWITRHLGLDPGIADSVKSITERRSDTVLQDTRLSTGTVLLFDSTLIDPSRLRDDLPVPVRASAASRQPVQLPGGVTQHQSLPTSIAGGSSNQHSAAPGRAVVPSIGPEVQATVDQNESLNLPSEEQSFVEQLLTDPHSVALDEQTPAPSGRALVSPPQAAAGSANPASEARGNLQPVTPPGAARITDTVRQSPGSTAATRSTASSNSAERTVPEPSEVIDFSPEASRPFQSIQATPEPLQPFGSSSQSFADSNTFPIDGDSTVRRELDLRPPGDSITANAVTQPSAAPDNSQRAMTNHASDGSGFSLAMQGVGLAASAAGTPSNSTTIVNRTPPPPPPPSPPSTGTAQYPVTPAGPLKPLETWNHTTGNHRSGNAGGSLSSSAGSQLLPPPPRDPNWPVISVVIVGILGALAASFLAYSIAHEQPTPRAPRIDTSGRYWLDRMIENDIPIDDEMVIYPHNTKLFGKPVPIQRIDALHSAIPRPHFSARGGQSGVLKASPAVPDAPSPDSPDSPRDDIVTVRSGRPSRSQGVLAQQIPKPPLTPAAELFQEASATPGVMDTAVFGDAAQHADSSKADSRVTDAGNDTQGRSAGPGRSFRLDTAHRNGDVSTGNQAVTANQAVEATETSLVTPDSNRAQAKSPSFMKQDGRIRSRESAVGKSVSVRPSPILVHGANLLDRILATVDNDLSAGRNNKDERQSDERGNS